MFDENVINIFFETKKLHPMGKNLRHCYAFSKLPGMNFQFTEYVLVDIVHIFFKICRTFFNITQTILKPFYYF